MRLSLGYPSRQAEKLLLQQSSRQVLIHQLEAVFTQVDILQLRELAKQVFLSDAVLNYILDFYIYLLYLLIRFLLSLL